MKSILKKELNHKTWRQRRKGDNNIVVHFNSILPVNIAAVIAVQFMFFKVQASGCSKQFYVDRLPLPTLWYFVCGVLFVHQLVLANRIWHLSGIW